MKIHIYDGYIENMPDPTPENSKFFIVSEYKSMIIWMNLRQLTMLRENLNELIDYLKEGNEPDDAA